VVVRGRRRTELAAVETARRAAAGPVHADLPSRRLVRLLRSLRLLPGLAAPARADRGSRGSLLRARAQFSEQRGPSSRALNSCASGRPGLPGPLPRRARRPAEARRRAARDLARTGT